MNIPSSGSVWRGPVPKLQVTPSASPSGWQDPQLLQASFDILPLKFRGMIARMSVSEDVVVGDPEGGEEGQLADQDGVLEAAGGRGVAGGDVELEREAHTLLDVHGRDREIGLVVGVAPCPILAHGDPTRQVARLDAAVHFGAGRVQDIELAGRLIEGRRGTPGCRLG